MLAAAYRLLAEGAWVRLEGCPETEAAFEAYQGQGRAWFVSSGTSALQAIMLGHEIGPGDEVITTPLTWGATISAILSIGAVPVFADVDRETGQLDAATVEKCLSARTKAVLTVHLFGHMGEVGRLREWTRQKGLLLLEDASQAHGARFEGRLAGNWGDAAAFSCMGLKLLGGLEGGFALFQDGAALERAWLYGKHPRGIPADRVEVLARQGLLDALQLGWRPCPLSAELVRFGLRRLDAENAARRQNAAWLREALKEVPWLTFPREHDGAQGCYHLLSLLLDEAKAGVDRVTYLQRLKQLGVEGFIYIPTPLHRLRRMQIRDFSGPRVLWHETLRRAGMDYSRVSCPAAEWRTAHSIEFGFNWIEPNARAMEQMGQAFRLAGGR